MHCLTFAGGTVQVQGINDSIAFGVNTAVTATSSVVLHSLATWPTFVLIYASSTSVGLIAVILMCLQLRQWGPGSLWGICK